jgi:ABC-type Fe3+/spermidine/putrescine transport system ATPase subunit
MNQGRIAQIGSPTELYDNPATPYVADFIGAANLLDAKTAGRDNDLTVFRIGDTVIRSARLPSSAIIDRATLGIRPERFLVSGSETANRLALEVKEVLFHGDRLKLELVMNGVEKPLFAELARTALPSSGPMETGSRLELYVEPSDILVFAGGAAG